MRKFNHDCKTCFFIKTYFPEGKQVDAWFCAGSVLGGSIVLREGDSESNYQSCPVKIIPEVAAETPLFETAYKEYLTQPKPVMVKL